MGSVQWRLDQAQLSWLDAHNGAFRAIGGVPWSVRFDNCKTAVASKGGPWAVLNPAYHSYAEQLGFVPDACRIRMPTDKGKTERRVQDVRAGLIRSSDRFDTLGDLQRTSDARIAERAQQLKCPLTDLSIGESWQLERSHLCPLPMTLPTPFDVEVQRTVPRDGLVWFEGRQYGRALRLGGSLRTRPGLSPDGGDLRRGKAPQVVSAAYGLSSTHRSGLLRGEGHRSRRSTDPAGEDRSAHRPAPQLGLGGPPARSGPICLAR